MTSISKNSSQLYRITYEAFSKFANNISRCSSLKEVGEVSKTHLKYLLNFHIISLTIQQEEKYLCFSLTGNKVHYDLKEAIELLPHEKELLQNGIPFTSTVLPPGWLNIKPEIASTAPVLWGWLFNKNNRNIIVSLVADHNKPFSVSDVDILKLSVDCFEAKFQEIYLTGQLEKKNQSLTEALEIIKQKNEEIEQIVQNQKQIISDRTAEIVKKNKKLLAISTLNAHNVREPLSRIQGIINLFEYYEDKDIRSLLIPKLESSAEEMDKVLQEVINMATKEFAHLNAQNNEHDFTPR